MLTSSVIIVDVFMVSKINSEIAKISRIIKYFHLAKRIAHQINSVRIWRNTRFFQHELVFIPAVSSLANHVNTLVTIFLQLLTMDMA